MRILSIAAPADRAGKTSLAATLCSTFPGRLDAVKFTTVYGDGERSHRDLEGPYRICGDREVMERPGTDTGRIAASGARAVHWAIGRPGTYNLLWPALQVQRLEPDARVVTEGNTAAAFIGPDLLVFLYNPYIPREDWKDNAWRILAGADVVVTNPWHPERGCDAEGMPGGALDKVGRVQPGALRVLGDVTQRPAAWEGGEAFLERVGEALDL